jgi:septum formation protein
MTQKLVLASASPFRKQLMTNAGLVFDAMPAEIDERAIERPLIKQGAKATDIAAALAFAKGADVSRKVPGAFVIGSDQTMSMDEEMFHKCTSVDQARKQLVRMRGKSHQLNSAIAIVRDGEVLWEHVSTAVMTFREFDHRFLDYYLETAGESVLSSVGAYQLEGPGVQLFEKIEGDYFTVLGLPMLPLLRGLRDLGAIDG